ncbi:MAG: TRAP transporter small permease subunit, partial [Desulfovibrio sp.]|nr:TRAP transporter small permease subunit [Desulfovibrio sp.]
MEDAKTAATGSCACRVLRSVERWTVRLLAVPSACAIAALFALVCFNVAGRALGIPVRGAVESSGVLCGAGAALALGYAHLQHAHIEGGVAAARLPSLLRALLNGLSLLATSAFFGAAAYELWDLGMFAFESG